MKFKNKFKSAIIRGLDDFGRPNIVSKSRCSGYLELQKI